MLGGRTFEKAEQLAAALGGRAAPFEALRAELARADIVISGTGAPGIVIQREDVEAAQAARRGRPLFLIDIAVPRDVERRGGARLAGVFLYDLDDIKTVAEANLRERKKEASAAEAILDEEIREFLEWRRSLDVVPMLVELRKRADEIRKAEIEKATQAARPADARAGERARGRDLRDRQQAAARADGAPQGDGRQRPARARRPHPEAVRPVSRIRIGTRGSALALWQANHVQERLAALGHEVELRVIVTTGDRVLDRRLENVGGKGAFLKEIEEAMLAGEVDLAVHSLKDVPTALPAGLALCAILERADPRDALLSSGAAARRPAGGRRRGHDQPAAAGAAAARCAPTSVLEELRGNVDTRIRRLREGRFDAILLAMAGLTRLGRAGEVTEALDPRTFVPAPGQGAIALECREDDAAVRAAVAPLDHAATARAVAAERAFLAALGGGCNVPLGAHAFTAGEQVELVGFVAAAGRHDGPARRGAGRRARGRRARRSPRELLDRGAGPLLGRRSHAEVARCGRRIVVTRRAGQASASSRLLRGAGRARASRCLRSRSRPPRRHRARSTRRCARSSRYRVARVHERERRRRGARPARRRSA